jgi:sugar O-acyltransferase (sialic acid O-acetyltransferase NeuD family)
VWYRAAVRTPLAIWGSSGHARVVADIVRCGEEFEVIGFLDDVRPERKGTQFCSSEVLGGREQLPGLLATGVRHAILAFGDNQARRRLGRELQEAGFILATAVHPRSTVAREVTVGQGTVVAAGAVVNPNVTLGKNVIINTGATVDHDCVLGDAVHVSPGAHLAGGVKVGAETWIGMGALVLEGRQVDEGSIIGAGAVVTHSIPARVVAFGAPARVVRSR